jgi:hypothetical protein
MPLTDQEHEQCGRALFNYVWTFLEKPQRTQRETDLMIHACHAMWLHWSKVGKPVNLARAEWQLARVYAVAGLPERAVHHGRHCLEICQADGLGAFDLACAYEALARAHAIAGDARQRSACFALAHEAAAQITDEEERRLALADLATVPGG